MKESDVIGVNEVCKMTGLTRWYLYGLIKDGLMVRPHVYGRVKKWKRSQVEEWIDSCEWKPGQDIGQAILNGDKPFVSGACREAVRNVFRFEAMCASSEITREVNDAYYQGWKDGRRALLEEFAYTGIDDMDFDAAEQQGPPGKYKQDPNDLVGYLGGIGFDHEPTGPE